MLTPKGIPLLGDRAAWDADGYPEKHANDVDTSAGIHHTIGTGEGQVAPGVHTHTEADITDLDHTDANAIHDDVPGEIAAIDEKTTPDDADVTIIEDSGASYAKKRLSWANIKAALKTYFDTIYAALSHTHTETDITDLDHDAAKINGIEVDLTGIADGDALVYDEYEDKIVPGEGGGGGDASDITYTPAVAADWDGDTDPGNVDDALDQLAERVTDIEEGAGGSGDMTKAVYDTDNDNIVDSAEKVNGVDTAGNSKYYGTNASGTPGFYDLPSGSGGGTHDTIFTFVGDLEVGNHPLKIHNKLGSTQTISQVFLSCGTAPTGADIIVDIHKNGTTIFTTQTNRPRIAAGNTEGYSTTIEVSSWADGDYLTAHIDQIGSGTAGANLVVHVIHS